jgi:hypothetical protein
MPRVEIDGENIYLYGFTADQLGADPKGSAAQARLDAISYVETRVQQVAQANGGLTANDVKNIIAELRGKPWGIADLGADGKLWEGHRPPHPSAQQIGAVPVVDRGKVWGVAELGGDGKLHEAQRPPHPTAQQVGAVPISDRGKSWGVAELGGDGKVLSSQLPNFQALLEPLYPTSHVIMWGFGKVLVGNPFGPGTLSTNTQLNRYATQSPAQLNDEVEVSFLLKTGLYRLEVWGMRNNQQGVYKIFINDFQLGSDIDRYAATAGPFTSTFNFEVFRTDVQRIRTKVVGRNASSVGFQLWISAILIYPIS